MSSPRVVIFDEVSAFTDEQWKRLLEEHGVTEEKLKSGEIIIKAELEIGPKYSKEELESKFLEIENEAFMRFWK